MARGVKKIETGDTDFLDLLSAAGVTLDYIEKPKEKEKDVKKVLCRYRDFVRILRDNETVENYMAGIVENGVVALDTETNNSLDIHDNQIVGLCLYTPYMRPAYIPLGHKDKYGTRVEDQVSLDFIRKHLQKLKDSGVKFIYHNAKFDVNIIRHNFGVQLPIYWDTLIAAKILNENRPSNGLKALYVEGIEPTQIDYHVTTFFKDNETADIEDFALYSATDSYDTYKIYKWQEKELSAPSMSKLRSLLIDLEFKVTEICADMEWRGFTFDEKFCENNIAIQEKQLEDLGNKITGLLEPYREQIIDWPNKKGGRGKVPKLDDETGLPVKKKVKKEVQSKNGKKFNKWIETDEYVMIDDPYAGVKMDWPILFTSPIQVLCLLNCILGIQTNSTVVDDLRATGNEIADLIGKYRHLNHNLTSFFKPYRELSRGGRICASFNQMGDEDKTVKTGRFSSKNPNLQQLPARQGEDGVRLCFEASKNQEELVNIKKDEKIILHCTDEVETPQGFVLSKDLKLGDFIISDEGNLKIIQIIQRGENFEILWG